MSYADYAQARRLGRDDPGIYALLMAAARKADSINLAKLRAGWPELVAEVEARYNAPAARLAGDSDGEVEWTRRWIEDKP